MCFCKGNKHIFVFMNNVVANNNKNVKFRGEIIKAYKKEKGESYGHKIYFL